MNIYAERGARVMFLGRNGYDHDREWASRHGLIPGQIYTVKSVEVESWSSRVVLSEVPGTDFNTAMFGDEKGYDAADALVGCTIGPEGVFYPDGRPVEPEALARLVDDQLTPPASGKEGEGA